MNLLLAGAVALAILVLAWQAIARGWLGIAYLTELSLATFDLRSRRVLRILGLDIRLPRQWLRTTALSRQARASASGPAGLPGERSYALVRGWSRQLRGQHGAAKHVLQRADIYNPQSAFLAWARANPAELDRLLDGVRREASTHGADAAARRLAELLFAAEVDGFANVTALLDASPLGRP